jgi:hypothetical protein
MTAAPNAAIIAATNSFFTGSLQVVGDHKGSAARRSRRN